MTSASGGAHEAAASLVIRPWGSRSGRPVVRCEGGGHRVRLSGGVRLWRAARCPVCRSRVDPYRMRRLGKVLEGSLRPRTLAPIDRGLHLAVWACLGMAIAAVVLLWGFSDRWWPATTVLFGPRWVLALPPLLLLAPIAIRDRLLLIPLVAALLILAGPVIDLRTGWRTLMVSEDPDADLRIATFNIAGGEGLSGSAATVANLLDVEILLLQECGGRFGDDRLAPADADAWNTRRDGSLCVLSRYPILGAERMEADALVRAGGSGQVVTYRIDLGGRVASITNLHLETPRDGFALLRGGRLLDAIPVMREKSFLRTTELAQARRWVDRQEGHPRIVAGDFNTPIESRGYRAAWSDWINTWSRAGRGVGGTRLNGWIRPRIDHILVDDAWRVVRSQVGPDLGSDHLPVVSVVRTES